MFRDPRIESQHLRAQGNLGYIQFLQLLQKVWFDAHPDIPLVAEGGKQELEYPMLTYRLDLRRPISVEPKKRLREEILTPPGEPNILIFGQRFQNLITFIVYTQANPYLADEIMEAFEDFMMEFTPVFKELGVSELVYARRINDTNADRIRTLGLDQRSVSYMVTTEKIVKTSIEKLEQVLINARTYVNQPGWLFQEATPATPILVYLEDQLATPNF